MSSEGAGDGNLMNIYSETVVVYYMHALCMDYVSFFFLQCSVSCTLSIIVVV